MVIAIRLGALVTGGKDSTLSLYRVLKKGYEVKYLITMIPQREDSWMFHFPNINLTDLFSKAVRIPLVKGKTIGIREAELQDLKKTLSPLRIDGVVHGAISSHYQKARIDRICQELELTPIAPLWKEDPVKLLKEMMELDFQIMIVGVYALGFDESWLGRMIEQTTLDELINLSERYGISPVGEGGEYETLVLDSPLFCMKIQPLRTEKVWDDHSGYMIVKNAKLVDKVQKGRDNLEP